MATRKWGSETLVNTTAKGDQSDSHVSALADGGYVVTWQDGFGPGTSFIRFQRFDALGRKAGGETTAINLPGEPYAKPAITTLADGSFWIAYTHDAGQANYIEGKVFSVKGAYLRDQLVIFSFGPDDEVDVSAMGAGSAAAWWAPATDEIILRTFDKNGVGGILRVANTEKLMSSSEPQVSGSPDGRSVAVVWRDFDGDERSSLHVRVFDKDATPITSTYLKVAKGIGDGDVVWLSDDQFALMWRDDSTGRAEVKIQLFGRDGNSLEPQSSAISLDGFSAFSKFAPALALLPDGGLAVAWNAQGGVDQSGSGIHLRVFDGGGNKVGGDIVVNTTTKGEQHYPSIAALADGRIAVTWTDYGKSGDDNSGWAVRSQIVDPRDGVVSGSGNNDKLYGHNAVGDEISGGDGNDRLYGLNGDDVLFGGDEDDTLSGGRGDDVLHGGRGRDALSGGKGDDTFVFDTKLPAKSGRDTVADFNHGTDLFELDHAIFTKLSAGELKSSAFRDLGAKGAKLDPGDRILYNSKTGDLSYDKDGSDKGAAVLFAHLDNHEKLSAGDFLVV